MSTWSSFGKQSLSYLSYLTYIPYFLIRRILNRVLNRQLLSSAIGIVLLLLVLEALAEYVFFWTFNLMVAIIEKAFREAFNFAWWALILALAASIGLEMHVMLDGLETEPLSGTEEEQADIWKFKSTPARSVETLG